MHNSKLISVLSTLTSDEWSSFRKYLLSQTGKASDNYEFFEFLMLRKKSLDKLTDTEAIREKYFSKFSSKSFLNMMSRLFLWLEEWISLEQKSKSSYLDKLLQIQYYNSKGLYKHADKTADQLSKYLDEKKSLNLEDNYVLNQLYHAQYYSDNPIKSSSPEDYLRLTVEYFNHYVLEKNIIYLTELHNRSSIHSFDYEEIIKTINSIIGIIPPTALSKEIMPLIDLVWESNPKSIYNLFDKLKCQTFRENSELHTIVCMYLISYALKLWVKGVLNDKKLIEDLYDYGLSQGVLMNSGKIPMVRFHNMISSLATIYDYKAMNIFIEKWCGKVDTGSVESTKALGRAQNAFYNDKTDKILLELRQIEFENAIQKTRALGLSLIGHFCDRKQSPDVFVNASHNFQRYLLRNKDKMSIYYLESHRNLNKILGEIYNMEFRKTEKIDITHYNPLIYRSWVEKLL